jgi:hypothetical protein
MLVSTEATYTLGHRQAQSGDGVCWATRHVGCGGLYVLGPREETSKHALRLQSRSERAHDLMGIQLAAAQ